MFIRQLGYLTALARERHFARAATRCSVSQPTLSAGIRSLENELGIAIVMRGQRFVGFTPEGLRVLDWAQRSLADLDSLKQEISADKEGLTGRIRIGAVPTALPILAPLTSRLLAQHPHLTLETISASSTQIRQRILDFELDLGITYLDNEPLRALRRLPLYPETYVFLAPARDWLDRTSVEWREATSTNLCLLNPQMQNRRIIDAALEAAGSKAVARIEADSFMTLAAFLQTGQWASIFPASYLPFVAAGENVKAMPIKGGLRIQTIGLVYPDRDPLPPSTRALLVEARSMPANRD